MRRMLFAAALLAALTGVTRAGETPIPPQVGTGIGVGTRPAEGPPTSCGTSASPGMFPPSGAPAPSRASTPPGPPSAGNNCPPPLSPPAPAVVTVIVSPGAIEAQHERETFRLTGSPTNSVALALLKNRLEQWAKK